MRRAIVLTLAVVMALAMVPAAYAQPTPTVTINGFIQHVMSYTKNYSLTDHSSAGGPSGPYLSGPKESEWYTRTRGRFDITGTLGQAMGRLGLEFDHQWGQSGSNDTSGTHAGTSCAFDLNVDNRGCVELRHLYTQFPVTGANSILPFIPFTTIGRFGAQPFDATYKLAAYASGDFGGAHLVSTFTPNVGMRLTYVQIEEGGEFTRGAFPTGRTEDWAFILGIDVTPMKGLNIRPLYSYAHFDGPTSGSSRQSRGGLPASFFLPGEVEHRHTVGFDMRWRKGGFSLDPTVMYQFGTINQRFGGFDDIDLSAWLVDIIGGFRKGPLLVEGRVMFTTGNDADDDINGSGSNAKIRYYQALDTDTTYWATWAEILALNTDFNNLAVPGGSNLGSTIGYDRYGRMMVGTRVFYDLTPALTFHFKGTGAWTHKKVDTDGLNGSSGIVPVTVGGETSPKGDARFLGVELDGGLSWRFAPGLVMDIVYGYLFAGDAFGVRGREPGDVQIFTTRVNYNF